MVNFLITGLLLGLAAGISPGPLLALVISETLKHGMKTGIKVSLVPVITDFPIIILTLFILVKLSDFHSLLGVISISGGFFILFMGYESVRTKGVSLNLHNCKQDSFRKGIIINILNPHPYLFWFSVGVPIINKAMNESIYAVLAFVCTFYILLVGSKIALAILVGRYRTILSDKAYIFLFKDGLELLGYTYA
jgi:threonine/homoserine/homoserine lactone efflux protein